MSESEKNAGNLAELKKLTDKLLQEVSGILDRQQRTIALAEKLARLPAETVVEIFRIIAHGAAAHISIYQDGFHAISDLKRITQQLGFGKMSEIYTLAKRRQYDEVVRFLQMIPPARQLGPDNEVDEDPMLKDMALGRKRQLAKIHEPDLINRLCHDQDPVVIQNLLRNPRVTLREVIKIASKRPTSAQILWTVYRDAKWSNHYMVKITLVNNPYTPTQISLSLLHYLMEKDLLDVVENMVLHPRLREAAADIIRWKRKLGKNTPETLRRPSAEEKPPPQSGSEEALPDSVSKTE